MLFRKGIVRRTFVFSALLIFIVTLISFATMYFIMPGYYQWQKEATLQKNLTDLTKNLQNAKTEEECVLLILNFSGINNAIVLSFDQDEMLLPSLSTPFVGMQSDNGGFVLEKQIAEGNARHRYTIKFQNNSVVGNTPDSANSMIWVDVASEKNSILLESIVGTNIVSRVSVSGTLQPIDEAKGVIFSLIPYVLALAVVVGTILSGIYAKQISKPILQISDAMLKMQQMEPDIISGIRTKDELGTLSENLDILYAKLLENIDCLKIEMDKVSRLERFKTELMQSASHELKTPITALSGMLEGMIDNIGVYSDKNKYLKKCKEQVDRLSHLVAEILGASKADITDKEPELLDTNLDELVKSVIAENCYKIGEKDLSLELNLSDVKIMTDPDIFYLALSNLISNAVRYTPPRGKIRIDVTNTGIERWFSIENECEAIPPEELPKLFEPFYTRSYSRDKTKSGTGLGLYIVKRSLERLNIPYEAQITDMGFRISLMM